MGPFLLVCIIGVLALMVLGSVVGALVHAAFWLITLPFRIIFKLLFLPFVAAVAGIGLVVALLGAVLSLLTPRRHRLRPSGPDRTWKQVGR